MIKQISFDHGWYYFYRLHSSKTELLCNGCHNSLKKYLNEVFENCPNEYFHTGPRGSRLKFKLNNLNLIETKNHELSKLTSLGLKENDNRYKSAHSKVQVFMLENDGNTLAVEVPLWFEPEEMTAFNELFGSNEPLTGHIDVLRIEDGLIWVWDYKPNASLEKFAATQVFFYALMLSKRTGIPLDKFRCGYFDSANAYMFKPENKLLNPHSLKNFI